MIKTASLKRRFEIEKGHFFSMNENVRKVLISYALFIAAFPLLNVFINAFFWRQPGGLTYVLFYNLGWYIGLPIGFYVNGLLLKKLHIKYLYFFGVVAQGISPFLAVFVGNTGVASVLVYGIIYGLAGGFYWANKNYLTLRLTKGTNRVYYNSIEYTTDLTVSVIVPILAGWIIVFGENLGLYSLDFGYKIMVGAAVALLFSSGIYMLLAKIPDMQVRRIFAKNITPLRWKVRILIMLNNMNIAVRYIVPGILVLLLIGNEGVLGTIQSITTLIAAMFMYIIGRKATVESFWKVFGTGALIYLLASGFLATGVTFFAALIYVLISTLVGPSMWTSTYTVVMEAMDKEVGQRDPGILYSLVSDNELFFNIGRIIIMMVFFALLRVSETTVLQWIAIIAGLAQIGSGLMLKSLSKSVFDQ